MPTLKPMRILNVHEAKTHLSEILDQVRLAEEVFNG